MIRFFDLVFSFLGCVLLSLLFIITAFLIMLDSRGPVFYLQERVGYEGRLFKLYKFRTMFSDSDRKGLLTIGMRDDRITKIGFYLRKYKIDELPQLINVFKGDMSLVGPRPEVKKYVNLYTIEQKKILTVKPGITDYASIYYLNENEILENCEEPERMYIEVIMPKKVQINLIFVNNPTIFEYFKIIFLTLYKILSLNLPLNKI